MNVTALPLGSTETIPCYTSSTMCSHHTEVDRGSAHWNVIVFISSRNQRDFFVIGNLNVTLQLENKQGELTQLFCYSHNKCV